VLLARDPERRKIGLTRCPECRESNPSHELQGRVAPADEEEMTTFVMSFFRRKHRRRIAVLHGPRHA
jgi:hypothetical protein